VRPGTARVCIVCAPRRTNERSTRIALEHGVHTAHTCTELHVHLTAVAAAVAAASALRNSNSASLQCGRLILILYYVARKPVGQSRVAGAHTCVIRGNDENGSIVYPRTDEIPSRDDD